MKATNALLSAAVVLLGLNLFTKSSDAHGDGIDGPTEPHAVAMIDYVTDTPNHVITRLWSDGTIDQSVVRRIYSTSCAPQLVCPPQVVVEGSCVADSDRNGIVDFTDLLTVLAAWGPCVMP